MIATHVPGGLAWRWQIATASASAASSGTRRGAREKREDHRAHLGLLGLAVAHERFLDEPRLVLEDGDAELRRRGEQDSARVRQLHGRGDVFRREDRLDRNRLRPQLAQKDGEMLEEKVEPFRKRQAVRGRHTPQRSSVREPRSKTTAP